MKQTFSHSYLVKLKRVSDTEHLLSFSLSDINLKFTVPATSVS